MLRFNVQVGDDVWKNSIQPAASKINFSRAASEAASSFTSTPLPSPTNSYTTIPLEGLASVSSTSSTCTILAQDTSFRESATGWEAAASSQIAVQRHGAAFDQDVEIPTLLPICFYSTIFY